MQTLKYLKNFSFSVLPTSPKSAQVSYLFPKNGSMCDFYIMTLLYTQKDNFFHQNLFWWKQLSFYEIETYNNIARYNLINTKYHQMAFQSPSDGALISPNQPSFGTPGQTKVSGDRQRERERERTHEICCLATELLKL